MQGINYYYMGGEPVDRAIGHTRGSLAASLRYQMAGCGKGNCQDLSSAAYHIFSRYMAPLGRPVEPEV